MPKRGTKKASKRGRPTRYTPVLAQLICHRLATGESLRRICCDEDMPHRSTVAGWLTQHEGFFAQYSHAREVQADILVEEIIDLADDCATDPGAVNKARLQVDSRKWYAARVLPKRWGDRIAQEISGPGGSPIATTAVAAMPVATAVGVMDTLKKACKELGLPEPGSKKTAAKAVATALAGGQFMSPSIYESYWAARERQ